MESENEVALEEEKRVIEVITEENINKEYANICDAEIQNENAASEVEISHIFTSDTVEVDASKNTKLAKVPYIIYPNCLFNLKYIYTIVKCNK